MQIDTNLLSIKMSVLQLLILSKLFEAQEIEDAKEDGDKWFTMQQMVKWLIFFDNEKNITNSVKNLIENKFINRLTRYQIVKLLGQKLHREKYKNVAKLYRLSNEGYLYITSIRTFND